MRFKKTSHTKNELMLTRHDYSSELLINLSNDRHIQRLKIRAKFVTQKTKRYKISSIYCTERRTTLLERKTKITERKNLIRKR